MNPLDIITIAYISVSVILLIVLGLLLKRTYDNLYDCEMELEEVQAKFHDLKIDIDFKNKEYRRKSVEYTNTVLEQVKKFVATNVICKFKTFVSGHDMSKITKANIEKLIEEVATTSNNSLNMDNIKFEDMIINKEYFEKYIVECSVQLVRDILEKYDYDAENI